jgi:fructoselysine-6-P-deglycase FrlB-like protein
LRLQDLTRRDIAKYVHDITGNHKYMQRLMNRSPVQAKMLMDEVVNKSSGVFLWVVLACRSLLSGFANYDEIAELQRRVKELPLELRTCSS